MNFNSGVLRFESKKKKKKRSIDKIRIIVRKQLLL